MSDVDPLDLMYDMSDKGLELLRVRLTIEAGDMRERQAYEDTMPSHLGGKPDTHYSEVAAVLDALSNDVNEILAERVSEQVREELKRERASRHA